MAMKIVVGFSGGVTSAWCAGWALANFPKKDVILLFHDTKEEHPDTYRFIHEMAAALKHPIVERSDGRSVTELFRDEGYLGNGQNTFCSRILKAQPSARFIADLKAEGHEVTKVVGYSAAEPLRVTKMVGRCHAEGIGVRFPVIEAKVTKQQTADWVMSMGVQPSAMYCWAEHANCVGCVKGGRAYWLAVAEHAPEVFAQRVALEEEFGHHIIRGGDREPVWLKDLVQIGLKRRVGQKEKIEIGACDCGD